MQKNLAQISFQDLLSANEAETQKWRRWFEQQPAAMLDVPLSIALEECARILVAHLRCRVALRRATGEPTNYGP
jgi:hypothetical protein